MRENGLEGAAAHAPPAAAAGSVVARRRRARAVVGGELAFIPSPEECVPHRIVVRVEARVGALLVAHALEDLVDGGIEDGVLWPLLAAPSSSEPKPLLAIAHLEEVEEVESGLGRSG
jgi:hypothetical protein